MFETAARGMTLAVHISSQMTHSKTVSTLSIGTPGTESVLTDKLTDTFPRSEETYS